MMIEICNKLIQTIQQLKTVILIGVTATFFAQEYFLRVVPTVVDEIDGKGLLRSYQYTYATRVSNYSCY